MLQKVSKPSESNDRFDIENQYLGKSMQGCGEKGISMSIYYDQINHFYDLRWFIIYYDQNTGLGSFTHYLILSHLGKITLD